MNKFSRMSRSRYYWKTFLLVCCCYYAFLSVIDALSVAVGTTRPSNPPHHNREDEGVTRIRRVAARDFQAQEHYWHNPKEKDLNSSYRETPVLVQGVLDERACEQACETLFSVEMEVQLQRKKRNPATGECVTNLHPCTLAQAASAVMSSHHDDARFVFDEGFLSSDRSKSNNDDDEAAVSSSFAALAEQLAASREALFDDFDWLSSCFPVNAQPSSACLVLAGEGATSTLHRDPMEWTGTSLCLEGTKVWRFLAPTPNVAAVDTNLKSYRLPSLAWGDGALELPLSAGWQSDFSLFAERAESIPSARDFDDMVPEEKDRRMQAIAQDVTLLKPNLPLNSNIQYHEIWTVVQRPGDMLIIPAHWWHQTYALEPSLAVASQRSGTHRDAPRLVQHVLETTGLLESYHDHKDAGRKTNQNKVLVGLVKESYEHDDPQEIVDKLFRAIAARKG